MEDRVSRLGRVFNPRAVAVVGDKGQTDYMWLRSQREFKGRLYSVNIDSREFEGIAALGVKNYPSLMDVPDDEIDYVIVAVPREVSPIILRDCIKKGVGGAMFFTSGFAETGEEKGIQLQQTLTKMAKEADFLVIGPNCMGIHNPKLGVRSQLTQTNFDPGPLSFISQSGTHSINVAVTGYASGVNCCKVVSIGNAIVLDATDYLEYLMQDEETKIIGLYIESIKDGRRFFKLLRECARVKPVLIWKGGQTPEGTRATASHTASLAEPMSIWEAMIKQAGAIKVDSLDEVIDTAKALIYCRPSTGSRMGLISTTGGQSVVISDAFAKAGLKVPDLSDESYAKFASFFNVVGGSYRNPIDLGQNWGGERVTDIMAIFEVDPNIDAIAIELSANFLGQRLARDPAMADRFYAQLAIFAKEAKKPLMAITPPLHLEVVAAEMRARVQGLGIPTYHSFERAAKALNNVINYHRFLNEED
ncbi:MAG: CoA-binding protein [Dehalococcoidia bacterium]|nr:CoA-binding protein [Dehalococcoidia bacterium]